MLDANEGYQYQSAYGVLFIWKLAKLSSHSDRQYLVLEYRGCYKLFNEEHVLEGKTGTAIDDLPSEELKMITDLNPQILYSQI